MAQYVSFTGFPNGMSGRDGQFRTESFHSLADLKNLVPKRDNSLNTRPAPTPKNIEILPTDKVTSFVYKQKQYFLIYDNLLINNIVNVPHSNTFTSSNLVARNAVPASLGLPYLFDSLNIGINVDLPYSWKDLRVTKGRSTTNYSATFQDVKGEAFRLAIGNYYRFLNEEQRSSFISSYKMYVEKNLYNYQVSKLFHKLAVPRRTNAGIGNDTERAYFIDRKTCSRWWERFLIVDEDGNTITHGAVRPVFVSEDSGHNVALDIGKNSPFDEEVREEGLNYYLHFDHTFQYQKLDRDSYTRFVGDYGETLPDGTVVEDFLNIVLREGNIPINLDDGEHAKVLKDDYKTYRQNFTTNEVDSHYQASVGLDGVVFFTDPTGKLPVMMANIGTNNLGDFTVDTFFNFAWDLRSFYSFKNDPIFPDVVSPLHHPLISWGVDTKDYVNQASSRLKEVLDFIGARGGNPANVKAKNKFNEGAFGNTSVLPQKGIQLQSPLLFSTPSFNTSIKVPSVFTPREVSSPVAGAFPVKVGVANGIMNTREWITQYVDDDPNTDNNNVNEQRIEADNRLLESPAIFALLEGVVGVFPLIPIGKIKGTTNYITFPFYRGRNYILGTVSGDYFRHAIYSEDRWILGGRDSDEGLLVFSSNNSLPVLPKTDNQRILRLYSLFRGGNRSLDFTPFGVEALLLYHSESTNKAVSTKHVGFFTPLRHGAGIEIQWMKFIRNHLIVGTSEGSVALQNIEPGFSATLSLADDFQSDVGNESFSTAPIVVNDILFHLSPNRGEVYLIEGSEELRRKIYLNATKELDLVPGDILSIVGARHLDSLFVVTKDTLYMGVLFSDLTKWCRLEFEKRVKSVHVLGEKVSFQTDDALLEVDFGSPGPIEDTAEVILELLSPGAYAFRPYNRDTVNQVVENPSVITDGTMIGRYDGRVLYGTYLQGNLSQCQMEGKKLKFESSTSDVVDAGPRFFFEGRQVSLQSLSFYLKES